ncbi:MAG: SurA N-terminal domain-containing protein [Candidatus Bipolaricaulota bacterium]
MTRILLVACIVFGVLALAQGPVALVNGEPITREELDMATGLSEVIFALYQQFPAFAQSLLLTEEGKAFLARYERDVLEKIILRRIQIQEAQARGLTADEAEIAKRTQDTLDQIYAYYGLTEDELIAELLYQGYTLEQFMEDIARQHRDEILIETLKAAVIAEVTVTEDEIESYYGTDPTRFVDEAGEMLPLEAVRDRIATILLGEKGEAYWQDWLTKAREGADVEINL